MFPFPPSIVSHTAIPSSIVPHAAIHPPRQFLLLRLSASMVIRFLFLLLLIFSFLPFPGPALPSFHLCVLFYFCCFPVSYPRPRPISLSQLFPLDFVLPSALSFFLLVTPPLVFSPRPPPQLLPLLGIFGVFDLTLRFRPALLFLSYLLSPLCLLATVSHL